MIIFLSICLILLIGSIIAMCIIVKKLLSKIEIYEKWIIEFRTDLILTLNKMREIDRQGTFATSMNNEGTFESDDQVGQIFKEILLLIEKLNDKVN